MRRVTVAGVKRRLLRYSARAANALTETLETGTLPGRRPERSAVDFRAWLDRTAGERSAGYPAHWRTHPALPFGSPARVGVVLHVHFPELLDELLEHLAAIPVDYDLVVTNSSGQAVELTDGSWRNAVVLDVDNHGRDIFPLVQVVNAGLLDPYDLVLKVHTKKSAWRGEHELPGDGEQWRDGLLQALLGGRARVTAILDAFARDPHLGVVTAPGSLLGPEFWGGDLANTAELLRRVELAVDPETLRFPAGSIYWVRAFVLQGLRSLNLSAEDFEAEAGQIDGTTAHAVERSIGLLTTEAGLTMVEADALDSAVTSGDEPGAGATGDGEAGRAGDGTGEVGDDVVDPLAWTRFRPDAPRVPRARFVPFYLPQFHPMPENDRWWGPGFTEWTNVAKAKPVYQGHHQPRLPADLGFYDLRLDATREAQAALAAEHGIEGFMYYYYWFAGRRLMSTPVEALAASDTDKPFCLMWANENWTRRWDGRTEDVLIGQDYDTVPAEDFIDDVTEFLRDRRYLRIDGRPVLAVYRIAQLPKVAEVVATWRERARKAGVGEILLLSVDVAREFDGLDRDPREIGLDGTLGFPPHNLRWDAMNVFGLRMDTRFRGNVMDYRKLVARAADRLLTLAPTAFPGVMVTFDNTARRQWAPDLWYGSNPYTFHRWLQTAVSAVADRDPDRRVVFLNAWNEWSEGAVLEPSDRFGRGYLHAVRSVAYA